MNNEEANKKIRKEFEWDCDCSLGHVQCRYVLPFDDEVGHSYCRFREGHPGPHRTCHVEYIVSDQSKWIELSEDQI